MAAYAMKPEADDDALASPTSGVRHPSGGGADDEREPSSLQPYAGGDEIGGKYRLLCPLGKGGMGEVWVAHHLTLDIHVAIKLVLRTNDEPVFAARLLREARAAARLDHPAIIRVLDFGHTDRKDPFIVMELLEGSTLAAQVDGGLTLGARDVVQILWPIADALRALHDKGIIHRDIKPDNIFLSRGDAGGLQPKLLDFGIARVLADESNRLTQRGAVMGSPEYMAPEQVMGHDVDSRVDMWAFCVVLYEAISGRRPFDGGSVMALFASILRQEPRPLGMHDGVDPELWAILARGLAKNRAERFADMAELGEALGRWLGPSPVSSRPPSSGPLPSVPSYPSVPSSQPPSSAKVSEPPVSGTRSTTLRGGSEPPSVRVVRKDADARPEHPTVLAAALEEPSLEASAPSSSDVAAMTAAIPLVTPALRVPAGLKLSRASREAPVTAATESLAPGAQSARSRRMAVALGALAVALAASAGGALWLSRAPALEAAQPVSSGAAVASEGMPAPEAAPPSVAVDPVRSAPRSAMGARPSPSAHSSPAAPRGPAAPRAPGSPLKDPWAE